MKITMEDRRTMVKHHAKEYQGARKGAKSLILDLFVKTTGYNRTYGARLLRGHGERIWLRPGLAVKGDIGIREKRCRQKVYGAEVLAALKRVWECLDYLCGKRLVRAVPGALEALMRHKEIVVSPEIWEKILRMSASTMDRLLAPERKKMALRRRSGTKPGSLLKSQIPVRTFSEWNEDRPGFLEVDLVAHDGGCGEGDFAQTLDVTDVCTGWSEQRAVLNKAQKWVFEAILEIQDRMPFPLHGLDSDNGSEFINHHLLRYCRENKITFTRSRAHRKNDTCYVEQKNYSVVRRAVGYGRFVGENAVDMLNAVYDRLRLRTNFFLPSMKLAKKERIGSRVIKRYDEPKTPYERVLESSEISESAKAKLRRQFRSLNPAKLDREIRQLERCLGKLVSRVQQRPTPPRPRAKPSRLQAAPSPLPQPGDGRKDHSKTTKLNP
jgi:hypothetical protein